MNAPLQTWLAKYNVPGPRYTSYPTVPAWTTAVGPADYAAHLAALSPDDPLSLYFHLPFCESLCHFCGCMQVITKRHDRSAGYTDTLRRELDLVFARVPAGRRPVAQLHLGGGTPNFFQPDEISRLLEAVHRHVTLQPDAELAAELHPKTSTTAFNRNLKALGFNRISLGVQDFDPVVQRLIDRHQSYEQTAAMVAELRDLGFRSFNFDLIYGLPGQSAAGWERTLEQVIGLQPDRLAVYSYAHVPWVRPVQRSFKDSDLPTPEQKLAFFETAYRRLLASGYRLIGMDHFARADDELCRALEERTIHRNFMGYSTRADAHQLGFGVSAISFVHQHYFQNAKELPAYARTIDGGELATFRGHLASPEDELRRDLIRRLMCHRRVDRREFERCWGIDFARHFATELARLDGFVADGLLLVAPDRLEVTGEGRLFLRNMAMVFDAYLEDIQKTATNPTFSKTV